jgi:hypothetical protein
MVVLCNSIVLFGQFSTYAPVLVLQDAHVECPSVSSCGPYYWGVLVLVYCRMGEVCYLGCYEIVVLVWCGCLGEGGVVVG